MESLKATMGAVYSVAGTLTGQDGVLDLEFGSVSHVLGELHHTLDHKSVSKIHILEGAGNRHLTHLRSLFHLILRRNVHLGGRADGDFLEHGAALTDDDANSL